MTPEFGFDVTSGTYLVVCLDPDAPYPSFPIMAPIMHMMLPGLKPEQVAGGTNKMLPSGNAHGLNFVRPRPAPGSSAHRYIFLLYEQPSTFDDKRFTFIEEQISVMSIWNRVRFDLASFEKEAELGPVIAANYFWSV